MNNLFSVDARIQEYIRRKYRNCTLDVVEFNAKGITVNIQTRFAKEFSITESQLRQLFLSLLLKFADTCLEFNIPVKAKNLVFITDDKVNYQGVQVGLEEERTNVPWRYIFIPPQYIETVAFYFAFFHELGHAWIDLNFSDITACEIFTDLVALCALDKVIPDHKKAFLDLAKQYTYIEKSEFKSLLDNPAGALMELAKNIIAS